MEKTQSKITTDKILKFGNANRKVKRNDKKINIFDIPAGFTCPMANECFSTANRETGKITDGKNTVFRCYAASIEVIYPAKRELVWHNLELIKSNISSINKTINLIQSSLPKKFDIMRIHSHGDFFNRNYFLSWLGIAKNNPEKLFYFYTKRVDFILKYHHFFPDNLKYNISIGGKLDSKIESWMKTVRVVYSENEAKELGLAIDHDDRLAYEQNKPFALLIHGVQPKNSFASKKLQIIKSSKGKA